VTLDDAVAETRCNQNSACETPLLIVVSADKNLGDRTKRELLDPDWRSGGEEAANARADDCSGSGAVEFNLKVGTRFVPLTNDERE
jgi:hypothetical protein